MQNMKNLKLILGRYLYNFSNFKSYKDLSIKDFYKFKINIEDIEIEIEEDSFQIELLIKGDLKVEVMDFLKKELLKRVSMLENSEFELIEVDD